MATHKQDEIGRLTCAIVPGANPPFQAQTWRPGVGQDQAGFEWDAVIVAPAGSVTGAQIDWDGVVGTAQIQLRANELVYYDGNSGGQAGMMFSIAHPGVAGTTWTTVRVSFYSDGNVHNTTRMYIYADGPDGGS